MSDKKPVLYGPDGRLTDLQHAEEKPTTEPTKVVSESKEQPTISATNESANQLQVPDADGSMGRRRGRSWRIVGFLLVSLALGIIPFVQNHQEQRGGWGMTTLAVLALASLGGGIACYRRGRKLRAIGALALMARDKRPPVLYLRSFKDDAAAAAGSPVVRILGLASIVFGVLSEEEQLAEAVNDIGPLVAIGKPGEKLPQLGAARMYVGDSEWQESVGQLMARARLVLLLAGATPGFWWEVNRVIEQTRPEKVLFVFPFGKRKYRKFRERAEKLLPHKLPDFPSGFDLSIGRLKSLLFFGPDWTPQIARLKARLSLSANPLVPMMRKALQPVREQLQLTSEPALRPVRGYLSTFMGTIPGVFVGVSAMGFVFNLLVSFLLGIGTAVPGMRHNNIGLALYQKHDLDGAIGEYREALRLNPDIAQAHSNLGLALQDKGDIDGAITECREAIRLNPDFALAYNNLGMALYHKHDVDGAIAEYREALRLSPDLALAHNNLGLALYGKHDLDGAVAEYREALRLSPDLALAHSNLGQALEDRPDLDGAIAEYRQAVGFDPGLTAAHYQLGLALYRKNDIDGAIAEYRQALVLDPDFAMAHNNLGNALCGKQDLDDGIAEYRQAILLNPDLGVAHYNLGAALYRKHDVDEAISQYREALGIDPGQVEVHDSLAIALYDRSDVASGIAESIEALRLDPTDAKAHNNLGLGLVSKGDRSGLDEFRKAYELEPGNPTIRANYEWSLKQ